MPITNLALIFVVTVIAVAVVLHLLKKNKNEMLLKTMLFLHPIESLPG